MKIHTNLLNEKQRRVYDTVVNHYKSNRETQLLMIVLGTASTGKSFVIKALKEHLNHSLLIAAFTGKAAYKIEGSTIRS